MQLIPRYLLPTRMTVILNEIGHLTEYMPVYARQLELYKGIDNIIQFYIVNADQKPVDISDQSVRFIAHDAKQQLCLDLPAIPVSGGDSTVKPGLYSVTITKNDLMELDLEYITYWIKVVDWYGVETITYTGSHFENPGIAKINESLCPCPRPVSMTQFGAVAHSGDKWYSDPISLVPGINGNNALHTAAIYSNGYIGELHVEVTLENALASANNVWSEVLEPLVFTGEETEPTPINFYGVYTYVRFWTRTDPTITKILIRT